MYRVKQLDYSSEFEDLEMRNRNKHNSSPNAIPIIVHFDVRNCLNSLRHNSFLFYTTPSMQHNITDYPAPINRVKHKARAHVASAISVESKPGLCLAAAVSVDWNATTDSA